MQLVDQVREVERRASWYASAMGTMAGALFRIAQGVVAPVGAAQSALRRVGAEDLADLAEPTSAAPEGKAVAWLVEAVTPGGRFPQGVYLDRDVAKKWEARIVFTGDSEIVPLYRRPGPEAEREWEMEEDQDDVPDTVSGERRPLPPQGWPNETLAWALCEGYGHYCGVNSGAGVIRAEAARRLATQDAPERVEGSGDFVAAKRALERIANLGMDCPAAMERESFYRDQLQEAIGIAARTVFRWRHAPGKEESGGV